MTHPDDLVTIYVHKAAVPQMIDTLAAAHCELARETVEAVNRGRYNDCGAVDRMYRSAEALFSAVIAYRSFLDNAEAASNA